MVADELDSARLVSRHREHVMTSKADRGKLSPRCGAPVEQDGHVLRLVSATKLSTCSQFFYGKYKAKFPHRPI